MDDKSFELTETTLSDNELDGENLKQGKRRKMRKKDGLKQTMRVRKKREEKRRKEKKTGWKQKTGKTGFCNIVSTLRVQAQLYRTA